MIGTIVSGLINGVSSYFKGKQEIKAIKVAGEIATLQAEANAKIAESEARITMAKSGQIHDYNLDRMSMKNMERSWKDELVLIVFLAPMIMAFIPGLSEYSLKGFEVISNMPDWYKYIIIGMIVVIYGLRGMLTKLLDSKTKLMGKL